MPVLDQHALMMFILAATAIGGLAWVFVYPLLSGEKKAEARRATVAQAQPVQRQTRNQRSRREQVEETLKELEAREQKKKLSLAQRISQAGLSWSKNRYILISVGMGLGAFLAVLGTGLGFLPALGFGFAGAFGLPHWLLAYLKKRREAKFLEHFPDAVDVIVRGIKAGLPLLDSMRIIAAEGQEPVRSEFKTLLETQAIGMPIGDACQKL